MTGYPMFNFQAFDEAKAYLESLGHTVISPADLDREIGFDGTQADLVDKAFLDRAMKRDCDAIVEKCTAMYMLKGWEKSTGARGEHALAIWKYIPIFYQQTL